MAKKVQVVALIEPATKDRLDILRVVMRCSRARVMEAGWQPGGLAALEEAHLADLKQLIAVATAVGVDVPRYAALYSKIYVRETYGPSLEELGKPEAVRVFRAAHKKA